MYFQISFLLPIPRFSKPISPDNKCYVNCITVSRLCAALKLFFLFRIIFYYKGKQMHYFGNKPVLAAAFFTVVGLSVVGTETACAHARFSLDGSTPPRNNSTGLKSAPCGGVERTNNPAIFMSGQTIEVEWEETINHPGYFRIAFSPANDEGFDDNVLKDNIIDTQNSESPVPHFYNVSITLPAVVCDQCTLQLIQVMTENPDNPRNYYSCADIKLVTVDNADPGTGSGNGQDSDSGMDSPPGDTDNNSDTNADNGQTGENNSPTGNDGAEVFDLNTIAQGFNDDFDGVDSDNNNAIDFQEAQTALPGITLSDFNSLDSNGDSLLQKEELQSVIENAVTQSSDTNGGGSFGFGFLLLAGLIPFCRHKMVSRDKSSCK
jgi:hypothetical protein